MPKLECVLNNLSRQRLRIQLTENLHKYHQLIKRRKLFLLTFEPATFPAKAIDTSKAGPRAVAPPSSKLNKKEEEIRNGPTCRNNFLLIHMNNRPTLISHRPCFISVAKQYLRQAIITLWSTTSVFFFSLVERLETQCHSNRGSQTIKSKRWKVRHKQTKAKGRVRLFTRRVCR